MAVWETFNCGIIRYKVIFLFTRGFIRIYWISKTVGGNSCASRPFEWRFDSTAGKLTPRRRRGPALASGQYAYGKSGPGPARTRVINHPGQRTEEPGTARSCVRVPLSRSVCLSSLAHSVSVCLSFSVSRSVCLFVRPFLSLSTLSLSRRRQRTQRHKEKSSRMSLVNW